MQNKWYIVNCQIVHLLVLSTRDKGKNRVFNALYGASRRPLAAIIDMVQKMVIYCIHYVYGIAHIPIFLYLCRDI